MIGGASRRLERNQSKGHSSADFELLLRLMRKFQKQITTPGILTEVDNLGRQLPEREHPTFAYAMAKLINDLVEVHQPGKNIVQSALYAPLGLTDVAIVSLSTDALILTDDFHLAGKLAALDRDVININHLRWPL